MEKYYKNDVSGESVTVDYIALLEVTLNAIIVHKCNVERLVNEYQNLCMNHSTNGLKLSNITKQLETESGKLARAEETYYTLNALCESSNSREGFREVLKLVNLPDKVNQVKI